MRACWFLAVGVILLAGRAGASDAMDAAYRVTDTSPQCVDFQWEGGDSDQGREAIALPVTVDGVTSLFMLDTGSDLSMVWGDVAGHENDKVYAPGSVMIGQTEVAHPLLYIQRGQTGDYENHGTLGLQALVGKVTVIDYVHHKLCLFDPAAVPDAIKAAQWSDAKLRGMKLWVPLSVGSLSFDDIIFDTGSSRIPLNVDLLNWREMTGLDDPRSAPGREEVNQWGRLYNSYSAPPAEGNMTIGGVQVGALDIFTVPGMPHEFAERYDASGLTGNAPFMNDMVVLDLGEAYTTNNLHLLALQMKLRWSQSVRFGVIQ